MKAKFSKRLGAYVIDIILIMIIITIISPIIPKANNYNSLMNSATKTYEQYLKKEITNKEFVPEANSINYELSRATYLDSIANIIIYLLYFVVLPLFLKGQTLGKKLMKIKVVTEEDKEVGVNNLLIRALLINGIASSIIGAILIVFLSKNMYLNIFGAMNGIFGLANLVSFGMIIIRKDGRGLHDLLGKTKVISLEEKEA